MRAQALIPARASSTNLNTHLPPSMPGRRRKDSRAIPDLAISLFFGANFELRGQEASAVVVVDLARSGFRRERIPAEGSLPVAEAFELAAMAARELSRPGHVGRVLDAAEAAAWREIDKDNGSAPDGERERAQFAEVFARMRRTAQRTGKTRWARADFWPIEGTVKTGFILPPHSFTLPSAWAGQAEARGVVAALGLAVEEQVLAIAHEVFGPDAFWTQFTSLPGDPEHDVAGQLVASFQQREIERALRCAVPAPAFAGAPSVADLRDDVSARSAAAREPLPLARSPRAPPSRL
jgi:hypothetical protein